MGGSSASWDKTILGSSGVVDSFTSLAGRRVLDLGCGKGRFSRALAERGVRSSDLTSRRRCLTAQRKSIGSVPRPEGCRLVRRVLTGSSPWKSLNIWRRPSLDQVCRETRRVLRPGGTLVIIDKNACSWNAQRPWLPSVAVKWIDERRGLWMYSHREKVRESWFKAGELRGRLGRWYSTIRVEYLLSPAEQGRFPFEYLPSSRLFVLWTAQVPGGDA